MSLFGNTENYKGELLTTFLAMLLAIPIAVQADTYRLTVEGEIWSRNDVPSLPSPITGAIGTPISLYWDIDDAVVPMVSPGASVYWQGLITNFGFESFGESGSFKRFLRY